MASSKSIFVATILATFFQPTSQSPKSRILNWYSGANTAANRKCDPSGAI